MKDGKLAVGIRRGWYRYTHYHTKQLCMYRASNTAMAQSNTHKQVCTITCQVQSGIAALLGTCLNFLQPLPAFSFTHPLTHSAGHSQWHICTIHPFIIIYPQQPALLLSMARLNVTVLLWWVREAGSILFKCFQHRPAEAWRMRLHVQVLHV